MSGRRSRRFHERQQNVGLKAGQYVSWAASKGVSKGRVVSVHTGKVPGVVGAHTATEDKPAARVQLYAKAGSGYEATSVHLAHGVDLLTKIDDLPEPSATEAVVAGSFDDIRATVQDAIGDRIAALAGVDPSIYVCDIGFTWAVYMVDWADDLWMIDYSIDAAGAVTLGDPVEVCKVTSYVPDVDPIDAPTGDVMVEVVRHEGRLLGSLGVDSTDGHHIFEVQIVGYGLSKNGRRYPESVMRAAAPLYEGAKAYDHHRTDVEMNTGTIVGLIGHYHNIEATSTGIAGELHLLPSATHAAEVLERALANQAAGMGTFAGISHDVWTQSKPSTENGRPIREVTAITGVLSADVVADPAAGGLATRMVANLGVPNPQHKEIIPVTYKQLLELFRAAESAKRPALLVEHAKTIESFGFTVDQFTHEVESTRSIETTPPAPVAPIRMPEATFAKASLASVSVIDAALVNAKLDGKYRESIVAELPEQFTEAELVAAAGRHQRMVERAGLGPTVADIQVTEDVMDKKIGKLDAFFAQDWRNGYTSFKEAYLDITGYRGSDVFGADFNKKILRESMVDASGRSPYDSIESHRSSESVTSATWGLILGDSITRRLIAEYQRADFQGWKMVASTFPVADFRTQRVDRMGDYALLPGVNQGAPYQAATTPQNEEATYAATKRGYTEDITLETIANDDIRAIVRVPQRMGIAAAETLYKFVFDFFLSPIVATYDGVATFNAAHGNTDTNALNDTNLSAGWTKMLSQSALNGPTSFLPVNPKVLLVPPALRQMGLVLCQSAVAVPAGIAAASNVPNVNQGLTPLIIPYWAGTTIQGWFLVADPTITPGIEIGLYQGREDPEVFVQNDQSVGSMFDSDKVTYKLRHIYGGTVVDHRGLYRGNTN